MPHQKECSDATNASADDAGGREYPLPTLRGAHLWTEMRHTRSRHRGGCANPKYDVGMKKEEYEGSDDQRNSAGQNRRSDY